MKPLIDIGYIPEEDIKDGLIVRFERDTIHETMFALADIQKGKRFYEYPDDPRKVVAVYKQLANETAA